MVTKRKTVEIGIMMYPEAQLAAIHGLTDLFVVANRVAAGLSTKHRADLRVSHWQQIGKSKIPVRVFITDLDAEILQPTVVIVPPSLSDPITPAAALPFSKWLKEQHEAGSVLCSVCSGAFLLAEAGLLDHRVATTHWTYAHKFSARYPDIKIQSDQIVIDDGDFITAGGVMAWTDLGLTLIERFLGPTVMMQTARFMLLDPPGREQRYYGNFSPTLDHGDLAVLKVQHWLQEQIGQPINVMMMAKCAKLEERTFLRRFHKATGLKPTEYFQHVRVVKAREILEFTDKNVDEIAWSVGYEDPSAFRKLFKKIVGLTPGEYRTRFGV